MKILKMLSAVTLMLGILGACTSTEEALMDDGYVKLSGGDIAAVLTGNTLSDDSGATYFVSASEMTATYNGETDSGTWLVDGDNYCRTWTVWGQAEERCWDFWKSGDNIVSISSDQQLVWSAGNSKGL